MSYMRAEEVLPQEILASVQQYVDGQMLYIPRKTEEKEPGDRLLTQRGSWNSEINACTQSISREYPQKNWRMNISLRKKACSVSSEN